MLQSTFSPSSLFTGSYQDLFSLRAEPRGKTTVRKSSTVPKYHSWEFNAANQRDCCDLTRTSTPRINVNVAT
eukprot:9493414-Pyramimonas_sp.AAC.1